jgi:hypothetical protein
MKFLLIEQVEKAHVKEPSALQSLLEPIKAKNVSIDHSV